MGLSSEDAAHLLRRVGFGPTASDISVLEGLSVAAAVAQVLDTTNAPAVVAPAEVALDNTEDWWTRYVAMNSWWLDRMVTTPCPIQEKLTLFWHGHFCSGIDKVNNFTSMWNQNQTFRSLGMGSFVDLTQAVAIDPAMLIYLDNWLNVVQAPNENWARESMELFTLGVDQYTQDDVVASARAWTGHGVDPTQTVYFFDPALHDDGLKTFMGVTSNFDGPDIINQILTGPTQSTAAQFIANELWGFLAYPNPDPATLETITQAFLDSANLDITALLTAILNHPNFWTAQARQGLVRTPTEFVAAVMRYTGTTSATTHPEWYMSQMGQQLFEPPNVAGWHQNAYWISSAAFWGRSGYVRDLGWQLATPTGIFADAASMTPADAVQAAFDYFGITQPSAVTQASLLALFNAENNDNDSWSIPVNLFAACLLSADFQLNQ